VTVWFTEEVEAGDGDCTWAKTLEGEVVARAVPQMKNLDEVRGFIDPIVDQDGSMYELTDAGPSVHGAADVREAL
jgi:hypothetical protein